MPSRDSRASEPLITRYRPLEFDQVVGNVGVIQKLVAALRKEGRPHAFLFSGPSGTGKTTLARICGVEINASIIEIDAASHSGVDDTRRIVEICGFGSIYPEANRMFIVDECHHLSAHAWGPLLNLLEEPRPDVYFSLCTTEPTKIPEPVETRCFPVPLRFLKYEELRGLALQIAALEGWTVQPDVLQAIVLAAKDTPRRALNILQAAHDARSAAELEPYIPPEPMTCEPQAERTVVPVDEPQVEQNELITRLRYLQEQKR